MVLLSRKQVFNSSNTYTIMIILTADSEDMYF